VMAGPVTGRNSRARVFRAALPCLALIALTGTGARAQIVTPDLFSSKRTSQVTPADSPLRRTAAEANDPLNSPKLQERDRPAPRRGGNVVNGLKTIMVNDPLRARGARRIADCAVLKKGPGR
jgi:hypothetical protein